MISSLAFRAKDAKDPVSHLIQTKNHFVWMRLNQKNPLLGYTFELDLMSRFLVMKTVSTWHASNKI